MILPILQKRDLEIRKLKKNLLEDWKDIEGILYYQSLSYISKIILSKIISCYYDDLLASYFKIKKTKELIYRRYF